MRWWDYSASKFNLQGRICLSASVSWGVLCVVLVDVIDPVLLGLIHRIPPAWARLTAYVLLGIFAVDIFITLVSTQKLSRRISRLSELAQQIKDKTGAQAAALKEKYEHLVAGTGVIQRRMLKAFPRLSSKRNTDALASLKERWAHAKETLAQKLRTADEHDEETNEQPKK